MIAITVKISIATLNSPLSDGKSQNFSDLMTYNKGFIDGVTYPH